MSESDSSASSFDGKQFVRTLTTSPGVYRMLDARGEPLYVGKAGNLKKRVGSYFLKPALQPRIASMIAQIARIEVTLTRTEGEALLLEAQLIKSLSRATTSCCATTRVTPTSICPQAQLRSRQGVPTSGRIRRTSRDCRSTAARRPARASISDRIRAHGRCAKVSI